MSTIADFIGKNARQNVVDALQRAKDNEQYHALLNLTEERALERADAVDQGKITGKLAGVPFVVKDNFLAFGAPTTAASKMLEHFNAPLQATAVEKLEAEGAICIGKANLDAFAHGGSTENSAFGPTMNAFDMSRVAGGSSGGSAVVTALDIVPFALGSDTGGSIREPASFNGVVGVKPTYGMISRYGVVAMASSTDVIGCFTTNVADAELVLGIMAGKDPKDMTTLPDFFEADTIEASVPFIEGDVPVKGEPSATGVYPVERPLKENGTGDSIVTPHKIGLIKEFMTDDVDSEVLARTNEYVEKLRAAGHTVEEVNLPIVKHTLAMYYIIVPAELSSNLARYDGIRYGYRAEGVKTLAELYGRSRDEGFVTENKRRIMIGSYVLSSGFFDAYYLQAQKARTLLINELNTLFDTYDVLMGPTVPTPAFKLGENTADPIKMYLADIMTVPASLAGIPAISVPAGNSASGLPIGVQLMAARRHDAQLLALARSMEAK